MNSLLKEEINSKKRRLIVKEEINSKRGVKYTPCLESSF